MDNPPEEAYGRVTNPERYRPLHRAARQVVHELTETYEVTATTGLDVDPELESHGVGLVEVTRLVPRDGRAAPVTVALTDFPSVFVRVGAWSQGAYPHCGCDACDEPPAEALRQLRRDIDNVVAGRVIEEWDGERLHFAQSSNVESSSGWTLVEGAQRARFRAPQRHDWAPWPLRP